jgi:hypothetical protein
LQFVLHVHGERSQSARRVKPVKDSIEDAMALFRIYQRGMDVMRCEVVEECERRPALLVRVRQTTYDRYQAESRRVA